MKQESKKFYLTEQGLTKIKQEHQELRQLRELKTKDELPKSLEANQFQLVRHFLLEENLNLLEERFKELENILKNVQLIKIPKNKKLKQVVLGATVAVESAGQTNEFTIVGSLEANPSAGKISDESPIGQALLNGKVGQKIKIESLDNKVYKIKNIRYK